MNRRSFLQRLALGAACGTAAAQGRKPNFIVIFADDLGYGDLACYGSKTNHTPHLDRMAAEGVRLTDFYVPMPFCAPSRATLLTGRYPFRHVVNNPAPDSGINEVGLPPGEITIAEALKPLGYASICIGKWHLGHKPEFMPRKQGFDEYYGILYSNDMRPVQLVHNEEVAKYPVVQADLTKDYTQRAIDFIESNKTKRTSPWPPPRSSTRRTLRTTCMRTSFENSTGQWGRSWRKFRKRDSNATHSCCFYPTTAHGSAAAPAAFGA
jgi:hypothetical protein